MHIHSTPHYPNYPIAPYGHTQGSRLEKDRSFGERFGLWYRNTKKTGLLQCTWQNDRSFYQKDRSFPKTTGHRCICKTAGLPLLKTGLSVKTTGFSPPKDRSFLLVWCDYSDFDILNKTTCTIRPRGNVRMTSLGKVTIKAKVMLKVK